MPTETIGIIAGVIFLLLLGYTIGRTVEAFLIGSWEKPKISDGERTYYPLSREQIERRLKWKSENVTSAKPYL